MTWSPWEVHARSCTQCRDALTAPLKPFRPGLCHTHIEDDDEDPPVQCPHPPSAGGPFCEHHLADMPRIRESGTTKRLGQAMTGRGQEVRT